MSIGVSWDVDAVQAARDRTVADRYVRQPVSHLCACGLRVNAIPTDTGITEAVKMHQREPRHRQWFASSGWK